MALVRLTIAGGQSEVSGVTASAPGGDGTAALTLDIEPTLLWGSGNLQLESALKSLRTLERYLMERNWPPA